MASPLDTSQIKHWRSIVTLVTVILINVPIIWPFHLPIYIPRPISNGFLDALSFLRILPSRQEHAPSDDSQPDTAKQRHGNFIRLRFPMNYVTAPLIAVLFLLAISAIGRAQIHGGIIGNNDTSISPYDVILVFLCLGYIANSLEASGLIRYLVFRVIQWTGKLGHRLFLSLYVCFFLLSIFIGNDPIMLLFLYYMVRVSGNIKHPRAWIHTQFAIVNIATGILVSSNPTNLVLAGTFNIKFVTYTAHMVVPVVVTAVLLFPFLLFFVFNDESLVPKRITFHELPEEDRVKKPVDLKIPFASGMDGEEDEDSPGKNMQLLRSVFNPFLDRASAVFGGVIMASTVILLLVLNAVFLEKGGNNDYWTALPAAFVLFCWDLAWGWRFRHERREISRRGRQEVERQRAERAEQIYAFEESEKQEKQEKQEEEEEEEEHQDLMLATNTQNDACSPDTTISPTVQEQAETSGDSDKDNTTAANNIQPTTTNDDNPLPNPNHQPDPAIIYPIPSNTTEPGTGILPNQPQRALTLTNRSSISLPPSSSKPLPNHPKTFLSLLHTIHNWTQETFPTTTSALSHLPYALVPFSFSMFILVEGLVHSGWIPVFAYGWDRWVARTGTVGSVFGMGVLGVVLSNFAGTNIGATILLSRVIKAWLDMHTLIDSQTSPNQTSPSIITTRTLHATFYSLALAVNFAAFSLTFSASLTGIMWRRVLEENGMWLSNYEFARINFPIVAFAMLVACSVLVGEVYLVT